MAILTQTYNLSMVPGEGAPVCVRLSAGDTNRALTFNLYDQNGAWIVPNDMRVTLSGLNSSGKTFNIAGYSDEYRVHFTTSTNAFSEPGSYSARVGIASVSNSNTVIYSDTFEIYVSSESSILTRNYASVS